MKMNITPQARNECEFAFHHSNHDRRELKNIKPYFYALMWETVSFGDLKLLRIGVTNDLGQRVTNHRSSFPGWRYHLVAETFNAAHVEAFWAEYFSPWKYSADNNSVFLVPEKGDHLSFFEFSASAFCACCNLDCPEAKWASELRTMPLGRRLSEVFAAAMGVTIQTPFDFYIPPRPLFGNLNHNETSSIQ